jgi:two-component system chemotaxis sensor kinase CheA
MYNNFIIETIEHIENIESEVLDLEQNPNNIDKINSIFRSFHTIKGTSGFFNFEDIGFIAHKTEALLDNILRDNIKINPDYLDLILGNAELIKGLINHIKSILGGQYVEKPEINRNEIEAKIDLLIKTNENNIQTPYSEVDKTIEEYTEKIATNLNTTKTKDSLYTKSLGTFSTIKVNSTKFDNLLNMIGELMIVQYQFCKDRLLRS